MKTRLFTQLTFIMLLLVAASGRGQESCSTYYPMSKGVRYEITTYNKKGKAQTLAKNEIVAVSDGIPLKATIHTKCYSQKNTLKMNESGRKFTDFITMVEEML